jgi:hypothetical protein
VVKEITAKEAILSNGRTIPFGMCVWSTGVGPTPFTNTLAFAKTSKGRLAVDRFLRVLHKEDAPENSAKISGAEVSPLSGSHITGTAYKP